MQAYIVEIETPSGRTIRKGLISWNEEQAMNDIRHMQSVFGTNGLRKCPLGEIKDCYKRPAGKPLPAGLMQNPNAVKILSYLNIRE